jgi:cytochrome b6-f complex subunit 6
MLGIIAFAGYLVVFTGIALGLFFGLRLAKII